MLPIDLATKLAQRDAAEIPISQILSHGGLHVGIDTTLEALTAILLAQKSETAAVTNDIGRIVGVISTNDLLAGTQDKGLGRCTARDLMHGPASLLPETASLATAAALMAVEGAKALPIACSECESICVLSALDILSWLGRADGATEFDMGQDPFAK